jgi:PadR family transcriptional regulator PadR
MAEPVRDHLDMLVLAVLAGGRAHGYAVIERLRQTSGEAFDLAEGTLYPALHRLERRGWVRSTWMSVSGRNRRVYGLTPTGRHCLNRKKVEWVSFAAAVGRVLSEGSRP